MCWQVEMYQELKSFLSNSFLFQCTKEYYMTMLGPSSFKKAIEEAEKLSESLKLRLEALVVWVYTPCYLMHSCMIVHQDMSVKSHSSILLILTFTF